MRHYLWQCVHAHLEDCKAALGLQSLDPPYMPPWLFLAYGTLLLECEPRETSHSMKGRLDAP